MTFIMKAESITKNSLYLLASSIIQKLFNLIYFVCIARAFGPLEQGKYSAALAFCTLFSVFIDFGASAVLTRETARNREKAGVYLGQILFFRLSVGVLTYGVILASSYFAGYSGELRYLIALAGISTLLDMISTAQWALFRGFQNFKYEGGALIGVSALMLALGGTALYFKQPLSMLIIVLILVSVFHISYAMILLWRSKIHISLFPRLDVLSNLLTLAAPFALAGIFSRIYTNADITLLARFSGEAHAGWYSAANKAILALQFIPAAITSAMYPAMSRYALYDTKRLGETFVKSVYLLLLIVLPMACGIFLLSDKIVWVFYGARYMPTILLLEVLSPTLIFAFLIFPLGVLLAATNRQSVNTMVLAGAAVFNVIANILLIHSIASLGSAWVSTCTYGGIFLFEMIVTWNYWKDQSTFLIVKTCKIICATCVMGLVIFFLKSSLPFFALVLLGVGTYGGVVLLLRVIAHDEIKFFLKSFLNIHKSEE